MDGYDNTTYYMLNETYQNNYTIVNDITSRAGERDYSNNCNISQEIPKTSSSHNVIWGSQKLIKESCPNASALNETPSHYAWNNFTKRISIVE